MWTDVSFWLGRDIADALVALAVLGVLMVLFFVLLVISYTRQAIGERRAKKGGRINVKK